MVKKIVRWSILLGVIGWLGSVAVAGAARYLELNDLVERVVIETRPPEHLRALAGPGRYLREVHARILDRGSRPDAPLEPESVLVEASPAGGLSVTVRWTQAVVTYQGRTLWAVPLSLTRSFAGLS